MKIPQLTNSYDFIIAGGGMAGLSLAYYLTQSSVLQDKSILIIDKEPKTQNDRTWCFWEIGKGTFEEIIYRKWQTLRLQSFDFEKKLDLGDYQYKMIRGIDFYQFVHQKLEKNPAVAFQYTTIHHISQDPEKAVVETDQGTFLARSFVFDSITRPKFNNPKYHNLWQHFKGYVIQTPSPSFNPVLPTLMDFRMDNPENDCRFMYILPFSEHTALVEFTLFSENILEEKEYETVLKKYIKTNLNIPHYQIIEEEQGVIPMSDEPLQELIGPKIIRIGTAGAYTNPATGYTFKETQKRLQILVENLEQNKIPVKPKKLFDRRFLFYASVLLNVLENKRESSAKIFTQLYKNNMPARIFRFLDGESSLWDEFLIIKNTNKPQFTKAALDAIGRRLRKL